MKKYCNEADTCHASRRNLKDIDTTLQNYCCYRATDIFEASV